MSNRSWYSNNLSS